MRAAQKAKLNEVVPLAGAEFSYVYDFGDDWRHLVVVEQVLPEADDAAYPVCVGGERACPPEDCGGVWGYAHLLRILRRPNHPEFAEGLEWAGGHFDPEAFDLRNVNVALQHARRGALTAFG